MQIGDFLRVFGVPKKRHTQRKWFGLKRCGKNEFALKELDSARRFQFLETRKEGIIYGRCFWRPSKLYDLLYSIQFHSATREKSRSLDSRDKNL